MRERALSRRGGLASSGRREDLDLELIHFALGSQVISLLKPGREPSESRRERLARIRRLRKRARRPNAAASEVALTETDLAEVDSLSLLYYPELRDESGRYQLGRLMAAIPASPVRTIESMVRLARLVVGHATRGPTAFPGRSFEFSAPSPNNDVDERPIHSPLADADVETEPGLLEESEVNELGDRVWLECAIDQYGFGNSGVRIESYAEQIASAVPNSALTEIQRSFSGQDPARAFQQVIDKLGAGTVSPVALAYLRRTEAVIRCASEGMEIAPKPAEVSHTPDPTKTLYLAHMRAPYFLNGYVTRTFLLLKILRVCGFDPLGVTRLGFPNDLAKYRRAELPRSEVIEGLDFVGLEDATEGLLRRPVDEYVREYAKRVAAVARDHRASVIHAASNYLNGLAAIHAANSLGIPSIYEVRGIWEITRSSHDPRYATSLRYQLERRMENLAVRNATRVVTISETLRDFLVSEGAEPEKVHVIPNGVDVKLVQPILRSEKLAERHGIAPGDTVIGYVGSLVAYEGLDLLIRAVSNLRDEGLKSFRLLIVGDGSALRSLKSLASELSLDHLCIFPGSVSRQEALEYYSLIDIAPFPRRSLPVTELVPPLKPYEAMAFERAVVVSNVAALAKTIIDGETGLVVLKDDIISLTKAIHRLLTDLDLRLALGKNGRRWVEKERSVEVLAKRMADVYASIGDQEKPQSF